MRRKLAPAQSVARMERKRNPGPPLPHSACAQCGLQAQAGEADHIIGDLIRRAGEIGARADQVTLLRVAYAHLKAYEARQRRARSGMEAV